MLFFRIRRARRRKKRSIKNGRAARAQYMAHKERARACVRERIVELNAYYGFAYGKISIRNQRTRWGSCSKKGNLNFNYKIVFLAPELRDYIIVHELCHVKEFNHSKEFWALVARAEPGYKVSRAALRKSGAIPNVAMPIA